MFLRHKLQIVQLKCKTKEINISLKVFNAASVARS